MIDFVVVVVGKALIFPVGLVENVQHLLEIFSYWRFSGLGFLFRASFRIEFRLGLE